MLYETTYNSPMGPLSIICNQTALKGIWFKGQKYFQASINHNAISEHGNKYSSIVHHWLNRYFNQENPAISELKLAPEGTDFRQKVWQILQTVPYGETITYKQIGLSLAKQPMSSQAIGGAVGHNPISIIIPCHRVVGANGSLTGYAAGIDTKIALLQHEHANFDHLFNPLK